VKFAQICAALVLLAVVAGCGSSTATTKPLTMRERQDAAMRDPMGYKPDFSKDRVSSDGWTEFDKDGFKKDLNRVFNP